MQVSWFELAVRGVRMPLHDALPAVVLVGPRDRPDRPPLALHIGADDAHSLHHELRGQETTRSRAVGLAERVAAALGGRLAAARLIPVGPGVITAEVEVDTPSGPVDVRTEPAQALAAAVSLGVPLLADVALFPPGAPGELSLSEPVASFLDTLDLTGLGEQPS